MTDTINSNDQTKPLLMTAKQAAVVLGIPYYTFNSLVRKKVIKPVEGFKSRRRYSHREILRYAFGLATSDLKTI